MQREIEKSIGVLLSKRKGTYASIRTDERPLALRQAKLPDLAL